MAAPYYRVQNRSGIGSEIITQAENDRRDRLNRGLNDRQYVADLSQTNVEQAEEILVNNARQLYEENFQPIEREINDELKDSTRITEQRADDAGIRTRADFKRSQGATTRQLSRAGIGLSADERNAISRSSKLAEAKAVANAENLTRGGYNELYTDAIGDQLNIGKNISGEALAGAGSAAGNQRSRSSAYDAAKTQYKQNLVNTVFTGAGIAFAAGI